MDRYETVKTYYDRGLWTEQMVKNAVGRWITEDQYNTIVQKGGECV